jgi:hypothetical protein
VDEDTRHGVGDDEPDATFVDVTDFGFPAESRLVVGQTNFDATFVPVMDDRTFEARINSDSQSVQAHIDRFGRNRGTFPE